MTMNGTETLKGQKGEKKKKKELKFIYLCVNQQSSVKEAK